MPYGAQLGFGSGEMESGGKSCITSFFFQVFESSLCRKRVGFFYA
jgi:hypothetical protein